LEEVKSRLGGGTDFGVHIRMTFSFGFDKINYLFESL